MSSIPGVRFNLTGASGSQGLLAPQDGWRCYVFPQGGHAAQDSTGTRITFDSASVAARFAVGNWIQVGLNTANIRQVSGVGGNSITVSGAALTVTENDRVFLIGNTQPTVTGGSATYTTPATFVRQRDDDGADLYSNSMIVSNSDGLVQFFSEPNTYDAILQDGNRSNQGSVVDLEVGSSSSTPSVFGSTVTMNAALGVTGIATFGSTVTLHAALGVTGWAHFGSTVTMHAALGVTGAAVFGATVTVTGPLLTGVTLTPSGQTITIGSSISVTGGVRLTTGIFGVSNQPSVMLYCSSAAVILGANSASIVFDQEAWDVGGLHTGTTSQIVIVAPGFYHFRGRLFGGSDSGAAGFSRNVYINKNGTQTIAETYWTPGQQLVVSPTIDAWDYAAAGDRYELAARYHAAGQGIEGGTRSKTSFSAAKVF